MAHVERESAISRPANIEVSLDAAIGALDRVAVEVERLPKLIYKGGGASSARGTEKKLVRSARGGGGVARAQILDDASAHCLFICGHSMLLIGAVNDCLIAAHTRDDEVNAPALAIATRALVETAALVYWIVDPSIDATTRGRRFLAWKFGELHHDRSLTRRMNDSRPEVIAARDEFDAREKELIKLATTAKWQAKASIVEQSGQVQQAALLQTESVKGYVHPPISTLVEAMVPGGNVYQLLSIAAHGQYSGIVHGTKQRSEPDKAGGVTVAMAGFGITPGMALTTVVNAVTSSTRQLAIWNGISVEKLDRALKLLYDVAVSTPAPK